MRRVSPEETVGFLTSTATSIFATFTIPCPYFPIYYYWHKKSCLEYEAVFDLLLDQKKFLMSGMCKANLIGHFERSPTFSENENSLPAPRSTKNWTISKWPSKQAALSGVELVLVVELTLAPLSTRSLTIWVCPAAAAHHNGGAPSIVSPSNVTDPACSTSALQRSTRYSTTSLWPLRQDNTKGVAPLVFADTNWATSSWGRWSRKTLKENKCILNSIC